LRRKTVKDGDSKAGCERGGGGKTRTLAGERRSIEREERKASLRKVGPGHERRRRSLNGQEGVAGRNRKRDVPKTPY